MLTLSLDSLDRRYVDPSTGESQIAYHEKEAWNIFELFHTRYNLHKRAYQHRVARSVERMFTDALIHANSDLVIGQDKNGNDVLMSTAFEHPEVYTYFTDSILHLLEFQARRGTSLKLDSANKLIHRIKIRKLYSFVSEILLDPQEWDDTSKDEIRSIVRKGIEKNINDSELLKQASRCGMYVDIVKINYGMGTKNPVEHIKFYLRSTDFDDGSQLEAQTIQTHQISCFVPHVFEEVYARVYIKNGDKKIKMIVRDAFEKWCADLGGAGPTPLTPERKKREQIRRKREEARSNLTGIGLLSRGLKRRKLDVVESVGDSTSS